jgi:hypothetical protein
MKTYFTRIVTWMDYKPWQSPQSLLGGGSRVIEYQGRVRVFAPRQVFYDDSMTPLYSLPLNHLAEEKFYSLDDMKARAEFSPLWDSPILDKDHYLKVYEP